MHGTLDLLERDQETSELDSALARARGGTGQVIAVEGPGGIGKTSLLAAARAAARDAGMLTLHARGSELERAFPFGIVRQLFEPTAFKDPTDRWFAGAAGLARPLFEAAGARTGSRPTRACTASTGCAPTSPPSSRWWSASTTRSGPTSRA